MDLISTFPEPPTQHLRKLKKVLNKAKKWTARTT